MSESNRVGLYYVIEESEGTLPTSPVFRELPFVSMPGLGGEITTIQSQQITPDRQVTDLIVTGESVSGDLNIELKPEVYDDLLSLSFFNEWNDKYELEPDDILSISGGVITLNSSVTNNYKVGDIVRIQGDGAGIYTVSQVASASITVGSSYTASSKTNFKMSVIGFEGATANFALDTSAKTLTITDAGNNKTIQAGEWVGFATNRDTDLVTTSLFFRVTKAAVAADDLTLTYDNSFSFKTFTKGERNTGVLNPSNSKDRIYLSRSLINGQTRRTLSLLQRFNSHNPVSAYRLIGLSASELAVNFEAQNIVQATLSMIGLRVLLDTGARTLRQSVERKPLSTGSDISAIMLGGELADAPNFVQSATLTINNNIRQQTAVGYLGAAATASGTCNVGGNLNTLFGNKDLYQQLVSNQESGYFTSFYDANDKKFLLFDIPRIKFSSGNPEVPGINTDINLDLEYAGLKHPDFGYQVICQSFYLI